MGIGHSSCFSVPHEPLRVDIVHKGASQPESTFSVSDIPQRFIYTLTFEDLEEKGERGKGSFGVVLDAVEFSEADPDVERAVAVKKSARETEHESLRNERNILATLDHPHIVRLFATAWTLPTAQVMENCMDGELFALISKIGPLPEETAKSYFRQILLALNHLHAVMRIVHRDLKPENVLLSNNKKTVKLCDFGTAVKLGTGRNARATGRIGSLSYAAPEVYESAHADFSSDMWSSGVLLYVMMCAASPFRCSEDQLPEQAAVERVKRGDLNKKRAQWKQMHAGPKRLILRLLTVDATHRLKAAEALQDPWILQSLNKAEFDRVAALAVPMLDRFARLGDSETRQCWAAAASQMPDWEKGRNWFELMDADDDGIIGFYDLSALEYPVSFQKCTFGFSEFVGAVLMSTDRSEREQLLRTVLPFAYQAVKSELHSINDYAQFKQLILNTPAITELDQSTAIV